MPVPDDDTMRRLIEEKRRNDQRRRIMKKVQLEKELREAKRAGDQDKINEVTKELAKLKRP